MTSALTASALLPAAPSLLGRDEINLAEFPFVLLPKRRGFKLTAGESARGPKRRDSFHIEKIRTHNGAILKQSWRVMAPAELGLPYGNDIDIVIALISLSYERGLERKIYLKRSELIERMKWPKNGHSYNALEEGLRRFFSIRIIAENAIYNRKKDRYESSGEGGFGIIASYSKVYREENSDRLLEIVWDEFLWEQLRDGNIIPLNEEIFFSLSSSTSKALYRFLNRRMQGGHLAIDIHDLAHIHLGASEDRGSPSQIKQQLRPALEELVRVEYLETYFFRPSAQNPQRHVLEVRRAPESPQLTAATGAARPDPAAYFYERFTGSGQRPIKEEERKLARDYVETHGWLEWEALAEFAIEWRRAQWPNMGGLSPFFQCAGAAAFRDEREHRESFRRGQWLLSLESAIAPTAAACPERFAEFKREISNEKSYKFTLELYQRNGREQHHADRMRKAFLEAFAQTFADRIPSYEAWRQDRENGAPIPPIAEEDRPPSHYFIVE
jgi:hypothetical protein